MSRNPKCDVGSGGPTFCWHCIAQLQRAAGKKKGLFYFVTVRDKQGFLHRVHGHCFKEVQKEGCVRASPPSEEVNKLLRRAASIAKRPSTGENRPLYSAQAPQQTQVDGEKT